ncbi:hypothetical protein ABT084_34370 [Streptomyces sp. NPDC002138]|uniref:hypothetical protein n=1 Tax=Streptomyces sp. NPDC002138 TaxID=3154410 RepID=UPI0033173535
MSTDEPGSVIDLAASAIYGWETWQLEQLLALDPLRATYDQQGLPVSYLPPPPSLLALVDTAEPGLVHQVRISRPERISWPAP